MNDELTTQLKVLADLVRQFELSSCLPTLRACEAFASEEVVDLAVLGSFNSGKSSLLNAILGEAAFPVGTIPVTAIITRASAGQKWMIRVTHTDGSAEEHTPDCLPDFVTESSNPGNIKQIEVVDLITPMLHKWPSLRLVDTPGLGSAHAHNTETTRNWLPNVAVALVTVSAERPLSHDDLQLITAARETAPRVVIILTKVDLLSESERHHVVQFIKERVLQHFQVDIHVLPFSCREQPQYWLEQLRGAVLAPVAQNTAREKEAALALKLSVLRRTCRDYLEIGLQSAERDKAHRIRLRNAVFSEDVSIELTEDELRLAERRVCAGSRVAFERFFFAHYDALRDRIHEGLTRASMAWKGNLWKQAREYEAWMTERLTRELTPLSEQAFGVGTELTKDAEGRFRRVIEAFRDRIAKNINQELGIVVSPLTWEPQHPILKVVPVSLGQTFMTQWDLLWWLLPMVFVGGLFRQHILNRLPRELEKNLFRLTSVWSTAADEAIDDLRSQAAIWIKGELTTLGHLLGSQQMESSVFRDGIQRLENLAAVGNSSPRFRL